MIECKNVSKKYNTNNGEIIALENINIHVKKSDFVSIVGPSGCGKTTLLKIIGGLIQPSSGQISLDVDPNQLATAMVFQEQSLFPWLTLLENAAFGMESQGVNRLEREQRAESFIRKMGLGNFLKSYPHELSGGMKQRVAIARTLLSDPEILLMDEPFGSLDAQTKQILQEDLLKLWRESRKTIVYITHDIEEAILMSDRILVMSGHPGKIQKEIIVPIARPRQLKSSENAEAMKIKWQIWEMLEAEVRQNMVRAKGSN